MIEHEGARHVLDDGDGYRMIRDELDRQRPLGEIPRGFTSYCGVVHDDVDVRWVIRPIQLGEAFQGRAGERRPIRADEDRCHGTLRQRVEQFVRKHLDLALDRKDGRLHVRYSREPGVAFVQRVVYEEGRREGHSIHPPEFGAYDAKHLVRQAHERWSASVHVVDDDFTNVVRDVLEHHTNIVQQVGTCVVHFFLHV